MFKKILLAFVFLLVGLLISGFYAATYTQIPEPFPASSQSAFWLKDGKHKVKQVEFSIRDESRETQAHSTVSPFEGLPYRHLDVTVWFPEDMKDNHQPLVVHSHGMASRRHDMAFVGAYLSTHGYIVIAADYPLTKSGAPGGVLPQDVINQPGDIQFLLDNMLNKEGEMGKQFSRYIDQNKIGAMGLSLGGLATALATYHPTKRDPRIKASVSIAGVSAMLDKTFYQNSEVPFMMLAGHADGVNRFEDHAVVIPERVSNSILVGVKGGSHMGFAGVGHYLRWLENPDSLVCNFVNWARGEKYESMDEVNTEKDWYPVLGGVDEGIIYNDPSVFCALDAKFSDAMNPIRQQWITKVATLSFFQSVFHSEVLIREKASEFLVSELQKENEVETISSRVID